MSQTMTVLIRDILLKFYQSLLFGIVPNRYFISSFYGNFRDGNYELSA